MIILTILFCCGVLAIVFTLLYVQAVVAWKRVKVGDMIAVIHGWQDDGDDVDLTIIYKDDNIIRATNGDDNYEFNLKDYLSGSIDFIHSK